MTTNHELQCLYEPYKAWNQNLSFLDEFEKRVKDMWFIKILVFLDEFEKRMKDMWFVCISNEI